MASLVDGPLRSSVPRGERVRRHPERYGGTWRNLHRRCGRALGSWAAAATVALALPGKTSGDGPAVPPLHLAETGLYSDIATHAIDARNLHYSPQYPLWSDGARKSRWIFLPPGKPIDASNPDAWIFPIGTKVWKEFAFGRRVETRYLEKVSRDKWNLATYVWNEDETDATRAPTEGIRNYVQIAPGKRHDIPSVADCRACHNGDRVQVLGFSALQLSPDRDPGAPHAEAVTPDMIDLAGLVEHKLIAKAPGDWGVRPPRIAAASPIERSALGYLHANCGNCHQQSATLEPVAMVLRQYVSSRGRSNPVGATAVQQKSEFEMPGDPSGEALRIDAGHPDRSTLVYRMSTRNPMRQMPPLGTKVVDEEAVGLVRRWVAELGNEVAPLHDKEQP